MIFDFVTYSVFWFYKIEREEDNCFAYFSTILILGFIFGTPIMGFLSALLFGDIQPGRRDPRDYFLMLCCTVVFMLLFRLYYSKRRFVRVVVSHKKYDYFIYKLISLLLPIASIIIAVKINNAYSF